MSFIESYGPWALITGASSGIGKEFAYQLAEKGLNLVLTARRKERLIEISSDLKNRFSIEVRIAVSDLSLENFLRSILKECEDIHIGLLVNNAGYGITGPFLGNDQKKERDMIHVNCLAPTVLAHEFGSKMMKKNHGGMIFVSSILGHMPTPFMSNYAATKSYNLLLGEALWYELKSWNIDVLVLAPGTTESEFASVSEMKAVNAMPAESVVSCALKSLGKKHLCIPGFQNKLTVALLNFFPGKLKIKTLALAMKLLGRS
ncbi:MAG: SDR family oxidoreductase [Spirochaetia bacterium]|nr:SDR family oxidoreductase [Spirochaetia bacterium]